MDHSPLRKLPAEVRNRIWEMALTADSPIPAYHIAQEYLALTRTCVEIRQETRLLFFAVNHFLIQYQCSTLNVSYRSQAAEFAKRLHQSQVQLQSDLHCLILQRCFVQLTRLGQDALRLAKSVSICDGYGWLIEGASTCVKRFLRIDRTNDHEQRTDGAEPPTFSYTLQFEDAGLTDDEVPITELRRFEAFFQLYYQMGFKKWTSPAQYDYERNGPAFEELFDCCPWLDSRDDTTT